MVFKNFGEQLETQEGNPIQEENFQENSGAGEIINRAKELKNTLRNNKKEKTERIKEKIEISRLITKYLLEADEKKAKELWENLDFCFKEQEKNGILAEIAFLRILNELGLKEAYQAPIELDRKNRIDVIWKENGKMGLCQVKAKNVSELGNLMREMNLEPEDLIIPLPVESENQKTITQGLINESIEGITQEMRKGGRIIREKQNYKGKINCFLIVIPSGKILKANGELPSKLKNSLINGFKNITGIAS